MRNTKFIKALIIGIVAFVLSCCESFTEVDMPKSQLDATAVFEEVSTANAVLADIYARMRENGMVCGLNSGLSALMGNYTDELTFYGTNMQGMAFYNHTIVPSNTMISNLWTNTYGQVYAANALLEGVEQSTSIIGKSRDRLKGEALFIRAYLHFYLLNVFGEIPYVTATDYNVNAVITKIPTTLVWQLIIADLTAAENLLPVAYPSIERVHPNKAVATAMLARVYLYTEDWVNAVSHADSVIANHDYIWEDKPENVFLKDSPSIIWSFHPGFSGLNTNDAMTFIFNDGPPVRPTMSENLFNAFDPGDLRKTLWTKTIIEGSNSWYHAYKYKEITATTSSQEYTILLRLAEQYLIRAEARAYLGDIVGSQQDLNKIRSRAGLPNTTADKAQSLISAIIKERRVELFTEQGHRWFDLKRTNTAASVLSLIKPSWKDSHMLLPLPQSELLLNANLLPQNPGY